MKTRGYVIMALFMASMIGLLMAGGGCAEKITGPGATTKVTVGFGLKAGPAVSYRLTVTATKMDTLTSFMAPMGNQVVAILDVPAGPERHFLVEALDLNGTVMYSGETTVDVSSLIPLDLTIDMLPVVPMIYLIPHFSEVQVGNTFAITVCANELVGMTGLGMGVYLGELSRLAKLDYSTVIDTVLIDPGLAEQGIFMSYQQYAPDDIYFDISTEGQLIVDENGDGCLATVYCRTQDTWSADSTFVTPNTYIEYFNGVAINTIDVFLDSARFLVIRSHRPESYLGTFLDDDGIALAPGNGETVLAGSNNMNNDPPPELFLAGLGSGTEPNWTSTIIWPKRERTTGLAASATGGFFACGSNSFSGGSIFRLDEAGGEVWRVETPYVQDMPLAISARPDGGCFVVGAMPPDSGTGRGYFIAAHGDDGAGQGKFGSQGFAVNQELRSVVTLDQSTLMSAGWISDEGGTDVLLVRGTPPFNTGRLQVQFGGAGQQVANDVLLLSDGDFLVVGESDSLRTGESDLYVARTDPDGNPRWARNFGSPSQYEVGLAVTPAPGGGFVAAGHVAPGVESNRDVYLVKFDGAGNLIWENTLGGPGDDYVKDIRSSGNGFIATGASRPGPMGQQDILVLRLNSQGEKIDSP